MSTTPENLDRSTPSDLDARERLAAEVEAVAARWKGLNGGIYTLRAMSLDLADFILAREAAGDDPEQDATDFAHPAWWRGNDAGVDCVVRQLNRTLDEGHSGTFGCPNLERLAQRLDALRTAAAAAAAAPIAERPEPREWR